MKNKAKFFRLVGLCFCVLCLFVCVSAQSKDLKTIREDKQRDGYVGVALVIGNSAYKYATALKSPVNDANDMARTLGNLGFKVLRVRANASLDEMDNAVAEFGRELESNKGVGVFYYSGHGVQSNGKNYLIPVDANIQLEAFLKSKSLDADVVLQTMAYATKGFKVVILDACRNNPFAKSWGYKGNVDNGLAGIYSAPKGTLIAFATSPNDTASDGNTRNSPYTRVLLGEMVKPSVKIGEMFDSVREILNEETKGDQTPWESTSLIGRFCFAGCSISNAPTINNSAGNNIQVAEEFYNQGLKCGEFDGVCQISNYSKAIELNSNYALAYNNRGIAYIEKYQSDLAIRDFNKAIEIKPNFAEAYCNRGIAYYDKDEYDAAIKDFNKAIGMKSNYVDAYISRGKTHYSKKDYNEAIRDYSKAIEIDPKEASTYYVRAIAYDKIGESAKAEADRKKYKDLGGQ